MIKQKELLAYRLLSTENKLNMIKYQDIQIGGLLAKFHENINHGHVNKMGFVEFIIRLFYFPLKGFVISKYKFKGENSPAIFLSKIASNIQCNSLIEPLKDEFKQSAIIYKDNQFSDLSPYFFTRRVTLKSLINIVLFLKQNYSKIKIIYSENNIQINPYFLYYYLLIQINSLNSWIGFFLGLN